jgi:hypothetical protein
MQCPLEPVHVDTNPVNAERKVRWSLRKSHEKSPAVLCDERKWFGKVCRCYENSSVGAAKFHLQGVPVRQLILSMSARTKSMSSDTEGHLRQVLAGHQLDKDRTGILRQNRVYR